MKTALISSTTAAVLLAGAAFAQTTGTINLTGNVPAKCSITSTTNVTGGNYANTVSLNVGVSATDMTNADGTLATALTSATPIAALALTANQFTLRCTGANNTASLQSTAVTTAGGVAAGYANSVDYTAVAEIDTSPSGTITLTKLTTGGVAETSPSNFRLAATSNNIRLSAHSFKTPTATDVLVAGAYSGNFVLTITPGL